MTIELRQVAIDDLSLKYARDMGNNNVRHYRLPVSLLVVQEKNNDNKDKPEDIIKNYIKEKEGLEDVVFIDNPKHKTSEVLNILDATDVILKDHKKIKKSLQKLKATCMLVERNYHPFLLWRIHDFFATIINFVIKPINKILFKIQNKGKIGFTDNELLNYVSDKFDELYSIDSKKHRPIKLISYIEYKNIRILDRHLNMTVAFEEKDAEEAVKILQDDLKILYDSNLIVGHLAMPFIVELADTVGLGKKGYILGCYPIIDSVKINKINNEPLWNTNYKDFFKKLGCKTVEFEGEIKYIEGKDPKDVYKIEIIDASMIFLKKENEVLEEYNKTISDRIEETQKIKLEKLKERKNGQS